MGERKEDKETKKNRDDKVGFGKLMLWQSRMVSCSIVVLVLSYLMIYCTDTLQISAGYVSVILVASKFLDGFTDMFAGFIVDRTKTKWGKGRPYEVFIIGLWLSTWLLFSCPESFSTIAKCIWIFIMYTLANSICYTFLNANQTTYMVRAYKEKQIVKLTSYGSVVTMLSAVIFNMFFPSFMGKIATSASGWSRLLLMLAVPLAAIGILRMIFVPEKYDVDTSVQNEEKLKVKDIVTLIKTNKYILVMVLMNFVFNFVCNMGVNTYYFTYIVGNIGLMGITAVAQMLAIPLAFVFPKLISKFSTAKLMFVGFLVSAIGYLINAVAGANMPLLLVGSMLTGAGTIPASMLIALIIIECAEFNEWKGNPRMEGTMSSLAGLGAKVGAALGAGALGILLSMVGYTGVAETMSETSYTMIRLLYGIVPMILYVLTALSLRIYKLDKLMPQIKADNEARRSRAGVKKEE
ncbi:MFS transporter [Blautia marasmi]|uniref:MFS transporter n=1 Tax=Blautia marasmi TaxID=1917868 RepID=UPI00266B6DC6|nr:MFS transporter [Blautia marasmi]